jgi:hypothetical protein
MEEEGSRNTAVGNWSNLGKRRGEGSMNTAVATEVIKGGGGEKEHCSGN